MSKEIKTLDETLQPYVEKALEGLEKGTEFVIDMAPELLREFYAWHFWSHLIALILGFMLLLTSAWIIRKIISNFDEYGVFIILASIPLIAGIFLVAANLMDFIKLIVAPKLYLIEYFLN